MARQTTGRETEPEIEAQRPASADELWTAVRVDPVEIALPKGVGYTLRAYRPVDEVRPTDVSEREDDVFPERRPDPVLVDEDETEFDDEDAGFDDDDQTFDDDGSDADESEDDESDDEDEETDEPEEVPVFLGRAGKVYLFHSAEGLVERISVEDVVPLPEDTYELDLVVKNLRASHDAWDAGLVIQAGEIARDLGYALRLESIIDALSTGSPLDELDEAVRTIESGGISGFLARRRLKKIGTEAPPLGWRQIIGNISAAVDWRD